MKDSSVKKAVSGQGFPSPTGRQAKTQLCPQLQISSGKDGVLIRLWWGLGLCLMFLGSLGANFGPNLSYQEFQNLKQEISQLPQEERLQLTRNLQQYEKLSPAEQQHYWDMHRLIEQRQLMPVVENYMSWLEGLSPLERQELRNCNDPAERIATVERLLREKREQEENRLPELIARLIEREESAPPPLKLLLRQREELDFADPYILSRSQLEAVINQVFLPQLNAAQQQELQGFQGTERIFRILAHSLSTLNSPEDNWPSEQAFQQLEKANVKLAPLSVENEHGMMGRMISPEMRKRLAFRRLLIRSLIVYEMQEFERRYLVKKNENDLLTYFAKLDSSAQATLLDSPADYQAEALKWLYIWNNYRQESVFNKPEFRETVLDKMIPRGWLFDRGGFRSRSEGPGGHDGRGPDHFRAEGRGPSGPEPRGGMREDRPGRPPQSPPGFRDRPPLRNPPESAQEGKSF